jgi:hypothetical protein
MAKKYHINQARNIISKAMNKGTTEPAGPLPYPFVERPPKKPKRGGARPGSGRPPGPSKRTVKVEKRVKSAVEEALTTSPPPEIEEADPFKALEWALKTYWRAGNVAGLVTVAREMLPYTRPKFASADGVKPLPEDLLPQPRPGDVNPDGSIVPGPDELGPDPDKIIW